MRYLKYAGLILAGIGVVLWMGLRTMPAVAAQPAVQMQTEPPYSEIVPGAEPVQFTLQAVDSSGNSLTDATIQAQLLTPAKTPWLSSDFPIVEGTTLLELSADAPTGSLQFQQVMPIRGAYQLNVQVAPNVAGAFQPFEQSLQFSVPENPVKYRNLAVLLGILLVAGFGGGWVIGGNQAIRPGEWVPESVRLLLSAAMLVAIGALLFVNISSGFSSGHSHDSVAGHSYDQSHNQSHDHSHAHSHAAATENAVPAVQQSQGLAVRLSGDASATVGQLATQTVQVMDAATKQPIRDVLLNVQTIALEHNELVFAYQGMPNAEGKLTWQAQFFDGAPHQVSVEIQPQVNSQRQFQPFKIADEVQVEAIAPPLHTRLITLSYFTAMFVLGLLLGLWRQRSRKLSALSLLKRSPL